MKRILLVDDEVPFLMSVADGLSVFEVLTIVTATNGAEAVKVLQNGDIDLVITDIQMPKMDGFELLSYLTKYHIGMPVIVISAFTTPVMHDELEKMGALVCLDKPIDFDELADRIFRILLEQNTDSIRGISVASFVQLLSMDRKTCCLRVKKEGKVGYLVMREGELIHARIGKLTGDAAAYELIAWTDAQIDIESRVPPVVADITRGLNFIIMEGLRLADELEHGEARSQKLVHSGNSDAPDPVSSLRFNLAENKEAPMSTRFALACAQRAAVDKDKQKADQPSEVTQGQEQDSTPPSSLEIALLSQREPPNEFAMLSGIDPVVTEPRGAWSRQSEPTTDHGMELSESGATTGPRVDHETGEVVMNTQKLQVSMDNMRSTLGDGLVANEVYDPEGKPLGGFGATQDSSGVMLDVTRMIKKQLEIAGLGKIGRYYVVELTNNLLVGVIITRGYTWAVLVDLSKVNMGVFVTIAIPKAIKDLQEAIAG